MYRCGSANATEAGCSWLRRKTAAAAEFGRWYQRTGGVHGPVLYTSLRQHPTLAALAGQLAAAIGSPGLAP